MGKSLRFLRFFAFLFVVIFTSNAFSAGYNCPEYKKYISCTSGYYLSDCGTDSANWNGHQVVSSPATGNTCIKCPTGYDCSGGAACPSKKKITCSPGYYLPANSTSCTQCGGDNFYCPGDEEFDQSTKNQGRYEVDAGYYSTGGTSTTRTGQSQCSGAVYCTGGVKYNCPSETASWTRYTRGTGWTSYTQCYQETNMAPYKYCTAGRIRVYANSATTWGWGSYLQIDAVQAKGGAYVDIDNPDVGAICSPCSAGTYSIGGVVHECSVCGDNTYSSAGASSCTSCYTVNGYGNSGTLASNHANESSCKLTCAAGTYVAASRAACSNVGKGFWRGTHTVSQGSISTRYTCPDTYDDGSATAGSQSECATHCDGGTYVDVAGGTCLSGEDGGKCTSVASGVCVPVDRGYYRTAHTVYYGQASDQKICPENYRDGAPAAILGDCVGRFLKTGTQVEGEVPENCTEVTEWNDCQPPTCYYEQNYSKVITKDCEPGTCTKRPNAVKADANYYDGDGTYCPACSTVGDGTFTLSDPGNEGGNTRCYKNCTVSCTQQECPANASCTHGQETSTGREYYSSVSTFCNASPVSCSLSFTCNPGYEKNEDGTACEPAEYTVTYKNGGGVGADATQSVTYNAKFTTKAATLFTRPGYNFSSWGGSYPRASTDYTYTTVGNTVLTAQWTACPNNPTGAGTCSCQSNQYPNGSGCSSCDVSCSEELVFNLGSYNVCRNETAGLCYRDCTTSDVSNATAVTGTITKGGTNSCKATSCATGTYLSNGTCATCVANATCAGGTDSFTCNSGYQLSNDGTECEPVSYTITLKKNGGTGTINGSTGTNDATQTCKHGVLCNLPASGLERFGYAFTGWGESEACVDGFTQKAFTEATTLYACWSQQTTPCQPGKYYDGTEHVTCPAGKFCSGEGNANIGSAACALDCPSGGTSTPGATTNLECYKPCSPTLDIQNGQGISEGSAYYDGQEYAACLYRAECDENYVPQNSPSTSPSCVWGDTGNCPSGFYCPPESPTPVACPDGGTSEIGSTEITQCYKIFDDYEGFSNGVATAKCLYQLNTTDYTGCSIINVSSCDGGYWYEQEGDFGCISVTSGFYSPVGRTDRVACPADPAGKPVGSDELASNYTDCYKTCDTDVLHSTEIVAESDTVYAVSADSYDACSFNVSCETGYSVINNNSESPSCDANEYTITLDKNGGSGTTPSSITCVFDSGICELPSVDDLVKLGYTAQDKWCADADGTAPCYYAGQNTSTNISSTGTDTTLYAVWTPNIYEVRLDSVNADLSAAPETVYLKYDNGWFSNSAATTGITNLTNVPEKDGYVFNGFYSEKTSGTQLISPEGNFLTSTEVLEFTTINPTTIYAQWSTGVVYCEPGTYYTGTGTLCEQCIENYYCPGGYFQTDTGSADPESLKACIGIWNLSEPGASKETDCYTVCENKSVENGTAMPENDKEYFATECSYKTGISNDGNPCDIIDDVCVETSCKVGYEMKNRRCVECNRENAISYKDGGICQIKECVSGFHPVGDRCEPDVQSCTAPNAILAEREWDYKNNSFGPCTIKECDYGYHVASNACVSDVQPCNVENGTGFKEWDDRSKKWGDCVATSCAPGYTNDPSESNEPNQQCGECKNKYSVLGKLAVSSYVQGCEIASCMYQGELYNLEYNECVPICPLEEYSDETGSMVWDESRERCVHTCNEGYTMW
ncbi:MAG TPA: InlB B-repeat-containing protein [Candidatus Enterousia avicola]|uniref:InlB B-repeat-containing protein n=1 Tax=Candidatus Enterousia avicola TaxID=2840787 RepID=A0A9D1SN18_9PROT|nr:InlB B-repeat-containing protein [Candidatus Enterousia avicola]